MTRTRIAKERFTEKALRILESPIFTALSASLTILALVIAITAFTASSANTREQINQTDRTAKLLRASFCGLVEPIASPPKGSEPQTPGGRNFQASAIKTVESLGCTPDPTDNK